MAHLVRSHSPNRCFCSPMLRCQQTAEAVQSDSAVHETLNDLREIDFGSWEKLTYPQVEAMDPEGVERWLKFDRRFDFGTGEPIGAFFNRVRRASRRIVASPEETILVVTHGGVIRLLLCQYLGLPLRHYFRFEIGAASLTVLDIFDGFGVLAGLSQCARSAEP